MQKLASLVVLLVLVGCGASSGRGDAAKDPTTTEAATTTEATTTTDPPTDDELYAEMQAEIERACNEAASSHTAPRTEFDLRWSSLSSPKKLQAAAQQCYEIEDPTTTTAPPHVPVPADFQIQIVETERSCYGSAGCNITYRINVTYTGQPVKPGSSYTVVYSLTGGDEPETKNFSFNSTGEITYSEDIIGTPPNPSLVATATQVLPD